MKTMQICSKLQMRMLDLIVCYSTWLSEVRPCRLLDAVWVEFLSTLVIFDSVHAKALVTSAECCSESVRSQRSQWAESFISTVRCLMWLVIFLPHMGMNHASYPSFERRWGQSHVCMMSLSDQRMCALDQRFVLNPNGLMEVKPMQLWWMLFTSTFLLHYCTLLGLTIVLTVMSNKLTRLEIYHLNSIARGCIIHDGHWLTNDLSFIFHWLI